MTNIGFAINPNLKNRWREHGYRDGDLDRPSREKDAERYGDEILAAYRQGRRRGQEERQRRERGDYDD